MSSQALFLAAAALLAAVCVEATIFGHSLPVYSYADAWYETATYQLPAFKLRTNDKNGAIDFTRTKCWHATSTHGVQNPVAINQTCVGETDSCMVVNAQTVSLTTKIPFIKCDVYTLNTNKAWTRDNFLFWEAVYDDDLGFNSYGSLRLRPGGGIVMVTPIERFDAGGRKQVAIDRTLDRFDTPADTNAIGGNGTYYYVETTLNPINWNKNVFRIFQLYQQQFPDYGSLPKGSMPQYSHTRYYQLESPQKFPNFIIRLGKDPNQPDNVTIPYQITGFNCSTDAATPAIPTWQKCKISQGQPTDTCYIVNGETVTGTYGANQRLICDVKTNNKDSNWNAYSFLFWELYGHENVLGANSWGWIRVRPGGGWIRTTKVNQIGLDGKTSVGYERTLLSMDSPSATAAIQTNGYTTYRVETIIDTFFVPTLLDHKYPYPGIPGAKGASGKAGKDAKELKADAGAGVAALVIVILLVIALVGAFFYMKKSGGAGLMSKV